MGRLSEEGASPFLGVNQNSMEAARSIGDTIPKKEGDIYVRLISKKNKRPRYN
jgi:hypothetical protein